LTVYIYDIEVFSDDWIVVFRNPDSEDNHIVIHNDNYHLRAFLDQPEIVIGGFNNKHYDDWIVLTMIQGGSNVEVKRHNDFIIGGGNGWEFPFVQYQKKPFQSFDLRDDIADKGISLKAIEGNMYLPIVESSVPFDIDRPLTPDELEEVIRYCKNDVDATVKLYQARDEYITSKKIVGNMYGVPESEALGLTNAKLSARVLNAKHASRDDERDYHLPECLDPDLIPAEVLSFFMQIRDLSIPSTKLFGTGKQGSKGMTLDVWIETGGGRCPVTYAWGGVHGAKPAFTAEATGDLLIVNYDVSSLYPNSMINFGYCSRSMEDPDAYKKLVQTRLAAKKAGDKDKATVLKLVVNTVYGAMLNQYNDLADRRSGRSVCITNQLAMTQLIVMLGRRCETIDFININTDGIMFFIDRREDKISSQIVDDWCKITGFEMERDDFSKVYQKDVNNYIGIKTNGKMKTKGGYVSLYNGGDFKTNSLQIVHKAVVEYLVNGKSPEEIINGETDVFKFQNIVKTGGTFEGSYHYINGELTPIQKVNRLYAVSNPIYGQVVKRKWVTEKRKKDKATGKMISEPVEPHWEYTTISECPDHTFIDNENTLGVADLDRAYYVAMAKDRINKYVNLDPKVKRKIEKIKEVITIMADKTTEATSLNIYGKILEARKRFLETGIKKTGVNRYAEYKYFTLDDIIPIKQSIFQALGLSDVISFTNEAATLTIFNVDAPEETISFSSQLAPDESLIKNPIQKVGAIQTYVRRYLYMLALDIIESDGIEETTDKPVDEDHKPVQTTAKKSNRPATPEERAEVKGDLIDKGGNATETQVKAIKNGLKKLRAKDGEKYESYVKETVSRLKAGLTKTEAEELLIEIGKKVEE
jgi:hypothetical protein